MERPEQLAERLLEVVARYESAVVAMSGGVDSSVVAKSARLALGEGSIAVTAVSSSLSERELASARRVSREIGIGHLEVPTEEFRDVRYARNDSRRCFYCKSELYRQLTTIRESLGFRSIANGTNAEDPGDYRPGLEAAASWGVRQPLLEAGLGKAAVREVARHWGLPNWDKPASPCLSSRIAPGLEATPERTRRIDRAEAFLADRGFTELRVRCHPGELARVEVPAADLARLLEFREELTEHLLGLGFRFVSVDLAGLRSGGLNVLHGA